MQLQEKAQIKQQQVSAEDSYRHWREASQLTRQTAGITPIAQAGGLEDGLCQACRWACTTNCPEGLQADLRADENCFALFLLFNDGSQAEYNAAFNQFVEQNQAAAAAREAEFQMMRREQVCVRQGWSYLLATLEHVLVLANMTDGAGC
jgi:hypothetical protein